MDALQLAINRARWAKPTTDALKDAEIKSLQATITHLKGRVAESEAAVRESSKKLTLANEQLKQLYGRIAAMQQWNTGSSEVSRKIAVYEKRERRLEKEGEPLIFTRLINVVCGHYGKTREELMESSDNLYRDMAIYVAAEGTGLSRSRIARLFRREYKTVKRAQDKVGLRIMADPVLKALLESFSIQIRDTRNV